MNGIDVLLNVHGKLVLPLLDLHITIHFLASASIILSSLVASLRNIYGKYDSRKNVAQVDSGGRQYLDMEDTGENWKDNISTPIP